jgi:hypothetical protein
MFKLSMSRTEVEVELKAGDRVYVIQVHVLVPYITYCLLGHNLLAMQRRCSNMEGGQVSEAGGGGGVGL